LFVFFGFLFFFSFFFGIKLYKLFFLCGGGGGGGGGTNPINIAKKFHRTEHCSPRKDSQEIAKATRKFRAGSLTMMIDPASPPSFIAISKN